MVVMPCPTDAIWKNSIRLFCVHLGNCTKIFSEARGFCFQDYIFLFCGVWLRHPRPHYLTICPSRLDWCCYCQVFLSFHCRVLCRSVNRNTHPTNEAFLHDDYFLACTNTKASQPASQEPRIQDRSREREGGVCLCVELQQMRIKS